jgi:flagellar motility protein MotE (MotC chaperone)
MMRDAQNYEGKKSNSPFFTPSEQRVQRYMASMRNREDTDKTSSPRGQRRDSVQSRDSMPSSKGERRRRVEPEPRNEDRILRQQTVRKPMSTFDIVKTLQEKLLDLTLELELINAEIATSSPTERNYTNLLSRKDDILDSIEDAEIDLVTAKSELL